MAGLKEIIVSMVAILLVSVVLLSQLVSDSPEDTRTPLPARIMQTEPHGNVSVFVHDDYGRPINNATVTIFELALSHLTNQTGWVRFSYVPVNPLLNYTNYSIIASKNGYRSSEFQTIRVNNNSLTEVDLSILGATVFGTVSDSVGPIDGALVSIPTIGYSNLTDANGDYVIGGIPWALSYAIIASATGYVNLTREIVIDVGGFEEVNFILTSLTGAISGTVLDGANSDPVSGADVSVVTGTVTVTVTTNQSGFYRIPNLQSGTYNVTVDMDGFELASQEGVVVVSGAETEDVDFELVEKPTRLYGIVMAGTLLLPGVLITVEDTEYFAMTSIYGDYEITNISAGTYEIVASLEGYDDANYIVVIPRGGEVQLNVNLVGLPGSLFGVVIASESRSALSGVEVTIVSLGTAEIQRSTITNSQGAFEFAGLAGGNYSIQFKLDGYKPKELGPVVIKQNGSATLNEIVMYPTSESLGGFIFGFDLAHSMMILALFLTIIILALAVLLRIRSFEAPDKAPAIYDEEEGPLDEEEEEAEPDEPEKVPEEPPKKKEKKVRKGKGR